MWLLSHLTAYKKTDENGPNQTKKKRPWPIIIYIHLIFFLSDPGNYQCLYENINGNIDCECTCGGGGGGGENSASSIQLNIVILGTLVIFCLMKMK